MPSAQELFKYAFSGQRDKRSDEYKAGVLATLRFRLKEAQIIPVPYKPGTAQSDAFFAGVCEGHQIARKYLNAN